MVVRQLQSVLNAAARFIYYLRSRDHITDALISLHCRVAGPRAHTVQARCSDVQGPTWRRFILPRSTRRTRPSLIYLVDERCVLPAPTVFIVPPVKLSTVAGRAFPVAAAQLWNIVLADSL